MSVIAKKSGILEILKNIFGNDEIIELPTELKESQERADLIMKNANGVTNVTSTKKSSGKGGKGSIVEKVEVNVENIKFSDKMIQTYKEVKEGQEK